MTRRRPRKPLNSPPCSPLPRTRPTSRFGAILPPLPPHTPASLPAVPACNLPHHSFPSRMHVRLPQHPQRVLKRGDPPGKKKITPVRGFVRGLFIQSMALARCVSHTPHTRTHTARAARTGPRRRPSWCVKHGLSILSNRNTLRDWTTAQSSSSSQRFRQGFSQRS
jgi:hypothetical protein